MWGSIKGLAQAGGSGTPQHHRLDDDDKRRRNVADDGKDDGKTAHTTRITRCAPAVPESMAPPQRSRSRKHSKVQYETRIQLRPHEKRKCSNDGNGTRWMEIASPELGLLINPFRLNWKDFEPMANHQCTSSNSNVYEISTDSCQKLCLATALVFMS
jgi:hypothetical protein